MNQTHDPQVPQITIESPFPRSDLPGLFCWIDRIRSAVADDTVPATLDEWMDYQSRRMAHPDVTTWGVYKSGDIGGYIECARAEIRSHLIASELRAIAEVRCVFKRDLWGLKNTRPSLKLALAEVFAGGAEAAFFPVFSHNRPLRALFWAVGARPLGSCRPLKQAGEDVETEMYAITITDWMTDKQKANPQPAERSRSSARANEEAGQVASGGVMVVEV